MPDLYDSIQICPFADFLRIPKIFKIANTIQIPIFIVETILQLR